MGSTSTERHSVMVSAFDISTILDLWVLLERHGGGRAVVRSSATSTGARGPCRRPIEEVRHIVDEIERRVLALLRDLTSHQ